MNLCFLKGIIKREVEFRFFYESKRISISKTSIMLENNSNITIKGYDAMADWMYHYLEVGDIVVIEGKIDSNIEIEVNMIRKL